MDHVGIVVDDLEAAKTFFQVVGLEVDSESQLEGEWVGRIIGLRDVRTELVYLQTPDRHVGLEITKFHTPVDEAGPQELAANRLGLRHIAFAVDHLDSTLEQLKVEGYDTVGSVENYQDVYRLCYVRGPEGIIVELAEELRWGQ